MLEQRHTYQRPTISILVTLKSAFDSVDRSTLVSVLKYKGVPLNYVNIFRALYAHTTGNVGVYEQPSQSSGTSSGVRQGYPIFPVPYNFVMYEVIPAQTILSRLARTVTSFGMCFALPKCKVMYQDWDSLDLDVVDRFTHLSGCLSSDESIGLEINAHISRTYANVLSLRSRNDDLLSMRGA